MEITPKVIITQTADCITNYSLVMIFTARERPQYIVVPFKNSKMKVELSASRS